MSQREARRGFSARQRSPEELAETLAKLAAATEEPRPRPRRPIPTADYSTKDIARSIPADPRPQRREAVVAEPPLVPKPPAEPPVEPEAPEEPSAAEPPVEPEAPEEPSAAEPPPVSEAPAKPRGPEVGEGRLTKGLVVGRPLEAGRADVADEPALAGEPEPPVAKAGAARARLQSRAAGRIRPRGARSLPGTRSVRGGPRGRAQRRSQPGRPLSAGGQTNPKSQRVRRIYAVLIAILVILGIIAIFSGGGGGSKKTHNGSAGNSSAGAARSAFPAPSTTPAIASTPTVASAPPVKHAVVSQGTPCGPLDVSGQTVSVHILRGNVTCSRARAVLFAFESGNGTRKGTSAAPYWTVDGWTCVRHGSCTRLGQSIKAS